MSNISKENTVPYLDVTRIFFYKEVVHILNIRILEVFFFSALFIICDLPRLKVLTRKHELILIYVVGIRIFTTGGIGGMHRDDHISMNILLI